MTEAIVALVVVLLAGCGYLAYRYRSERGIESGISSFRRELSALAPRRDPSAPARDHAPRTMRDPERAEADATPPATDPATDDVGTGGDQTTGGQHAGDPPTDGDGPAGAGR